MCVCVSLLCMLLAFYLTAYFVNVFERVYLTVIILQWRTNESWRMAPFVWPLFWKWNLPHSPEWLALFWRVWGQEFYLCLFSCSPEVWSGFDWSPTCPATRILRRHNLAQSRPKTYHEKVGHLFLFQHYKRRKFWLWRQFCWQSNCGSNHSTSTIRRATVRTTATTAATMFIQQCITSTTSVRALGSSPFGSGDKWNKNHGKLSHRKPLFDCSHSFHSKRW